VSLITNDFFARPTLTVARALLGQRLVRELNGQQLNGRIVETEAYIGPADSANHAKQRPHRPDGSNVWPPGRTYVY